MQTVRYQDLGRLDYREAWDYQTALHRALVDNKLNHRDQAPGAYPQNHTLLLVEHPPVYTLGKSGSIENLLLTETELTERGIQYFPINRGGDITYHGPGQIVGYPVLDLECFFTDVHRYVRNLEEVIIRTLADYGVEAYRLPGYTGVWVKGPVGKGQIGKGQGASGQIGKGQGANSPREWEMDAATAAKQRKICAIGVHLSRWVTLHGFAFNINTDLNYFKYIVPCGIVDEDKTVTSLALELGRPVDMAAVRECLVGHFADVFECRVESQTPVLPSSVTTS